MCLGCDGRQKSGAEGSCKTAIGIALAAGVIAASAVRCIHGSFHADVCDRATWFAVLSHFSAAFSPARSTSVLIPMSGCCPIITTEIVTACHFVSAPDPRLPFVCLFGGYPFGGCSAWRPRRSRSDQTRSMWAASVHWLQSYSRGTPHLRPVAGKRTDTNDGRRDNAIHLPMADRSDRAADQAPALLLRCSARRSASRHGRRFERIDFSRRVLIFGWSGTAMERQTTLLRFLALN